MGATFSQIWPPSPTLTEKNLPSQKGKVFIVTGAASGIGFHLASILYAAGAKVYLAARSAERATQAIGKIQSLAKDTPTPGELRFLFLDLSDLTTIKASAQKFQEQESRLDVLWNNAGVALPPPGSVSKQGYELQLATNCLGPYLFTQFLLPPLEAAAKDSPPNTVRVVWTSSLFVEQAAPKGGFEMSHLAAPPKDQNLNYANSKTGNWFLASEMARRSGPSGILSLTQNPGNLKTPLLRCKSWLYQLAVSPLLWDAKLGAYTELWAGLAEELDQSMNGGYVVPWGRMHPAPREDMLPALKDKQDGGTGKAAEFWEWCDARTKEFR
ncbi:MAG: hypothetical protein Q9227_006176 [Pyrenula ochraceoflavens]